MATKTHKVYALNPVVLIRSHVELLQYVSWLTDLKNLHGRGIGVIDIFDHVHETNQQKKATVDFSHDSLVLLCGERRQD